MTRRSCDHSKAVTHQDNEETKLLPQEVASVNSHATDSATRTPSAVLDSEDEDYPDQTDNAIHFQIPPKTNQDHIQSHPVNIERPSLRVRFRSRVRITAGIGPRPRRLSDASISGSASSSISVPLRMPDSKGSKGWAPLGRRISQLASQASSAHGHNAEGRCGVNGNGSTRKKYRSMSFPGASANERTRLVSLYNGYSCTAGCTDTHRHRREEWRQQVVDITFGKWPWRLFNRHWWWWKLEPILCCFCICEDPAEEET